MTTIKYWRITVDVESENMSEGQLLELLGLRCNRGGGIYMGVEKKTEGLSDPKVKLLRTKKD